MTAVPPEPRRGGQAPEIGERRVRRGEADGARTNEVNDASGRGLSTQEGHTTNHDRADGKGGGDRGRMGTAGRGLEGTSSGWSGAENRGS